MTVADDIAALQTTLTMYEAARDAIVTGRVAQIGYKSNDAELLSITDLEKLITSYRRRIARLSGGTGFQRMTPGRAR